MNIEFILKFCLSTALAMGSLVFGTLAVTIWYINK